MTTCSNIKINTGGSYATPLRYPGGKGRLGPWLAQVMQYNGMDDGWYIEPYAGGAGAALHLLTLGIVSHVVINDADPVVFAFWEAATKHPEALIEKIRRTPVNIDTWERQKGIIENCENEDVVDIGFATFFLNRTNRSGILTAGVIGGKAQAGQWKINARYNQDSLCNRIEKIGSLGDKVTVLCMDALNLLTDASPGFPNKCLVYLDPPYYIKGSQLYRNHYLPEDHAAISRCVADADFPVVVTYDDCPEVSALYEGVDSSEFSLHYSTHAARPKVREALYYKNLELPCAPSLTRGLSF